MRKLYLVSYDLRNPGRNYQPLWDALKRLGAKSVLKSQWVLRHQASAFDICDQLVKFVDSNDQMIVSEITSDTAWYNTVDISTAA